jgi:3',5'-cyclic AMP phosphodiesterase CpdA
VRSPLRRGGQPDIEAGRVFLEIANGVAISASDMHYWPGEPTLMHRALVHIIRKLAPDLVVVNGDVVDMGTVSRFPPLGWDRLPTVQEEIEVAQERLHELAMAAGRAHKIWTCGNHDSRFERRLIEKAPEYAKVQGMHLKDHFPLWEPAWDVFVNDAAPHPGDRVVFKHRFKGGVHHAYNDTLHSGRTIVTGDKHAAQVTQFTDFNGTRWGVDNGCIAHPSHRAFAYGENSPRNWRDSFAVLSFVDGRLMPPELVFRWSENSFVFRGEIITMRDDTQPAQSGRSMPEPTPGDDEDDYEGKRPRRRWRAAKRREAKRERKR